MVIYEVNLFVDREIEVEYRKWLPAHVDELVKLPGFKAAQIYEKESENGDDPSKVYLCVQYQLDNRKSLERYLKEDAPKMRKAAVDRFGAKFQAQRRILLSK